MRSVVAASPVIRSSGPDGRPTRPVNRDVPPSTVGPPSPPARPYVFGQGPVTEVEAEVAGVRLVRYDGPGGGDSPEDGA
jgi:hypothetical protein